MAPGRWSLLGSGPCRFDLPVHALGRASITRAMRPELIIEGHGARDPLLSIVDGLVRIEMDLLIFETPPQPFDKDVVPPPPGPIHADLNPMSLQKPGEFLAGELTALIGVEDLRRVIPGDGLLHRLQAEVCG